LRTEPPLDLSERDIVSFGSELHDPGGRNCVAAFDHVLVLLSFVYALALTHLLSRIGTLVLARERVRFSGLLAVCMANAVLMVFTNWLSLWDVRGMHDWDLFSVTMQFAFAVAIYFLCALAAPEINSEDIIDMESFYWRNRRLFYAVLMACMFLSLIINAEFLKTPNTALFVQENAAVLPMIIAVGVPLVLAARWAQWVGGMGMVGLLVTFTILFSGTLH
jgi:hypothetical protein